MTNRVSRLNFRFTPRINDIIELITCNCSHPNWQEQSHNNALGLKSTEQLYYAVNILRKIISLFSMSRL